MGVQFGRWNLDGELIDKEYLRRAVSMISPYGPNGGGTYVNNNVGIVYRALHTTNEDCKEVQPCVLGSDIVLAYDGRLDNRRTLLSQLPAKLSSDSPDVSIVSSAYEHWGVDCFRRLIGDWAVSLWNPTDRSLIFAKDFVGNRPLYYALEKDKVTWSTILDPLVLLAGRSFELDEEYMAGWLSFFPAARLTPYVGIHSVPPSSFVRFADGKIQITKYWDFNPSTMIRYRTDQEYEEHFRTLFFESVRRRLRSDKPVIAELSGGMDSSAIVCVADNLLNAGKAEAPRLDTVSYFDDHEPNWNERPYFEMVELHRGRSGCHIDVGSISAIDAMYQNDQFAATPASRRGLTDSARQFNEYFSTQGASILLSGIGGDEVLGGVPTPIPELANLLARAHLVSLARRLAAWALATKKPIAHLLAEVVAEFLPAQPGVAHSKILATWLNPGLVRRNTSAVRGYQRRLQLFGPLPSFQLNVYAFDTLRRQLACISPPLDPPHERRYPYLDRDLLEFLYAIPREQLVQPGGRRSLMRRALSAIVPEEVLKRRRKGFVVRGPMASVSAAWRVLLAMSERMATCSAGVVDPKAFVEVLERIHKGSGVPIGPMMRTLALEYWLQHLQERGLVTPLPRSPNIGTYRKPQTDSPRSRKSQPDANASIYQLSLNGKQDNPLFMHGTHHLRLHDASQIKRVTSCISISTS